MEPEITSEESRGAATVNRAGLPRIQILSDGVVNKIAAGEVVERPASVVKELMENALDAGARQVSVTLVEGGRTSITVMDNGCGMLQEDLELAIRRHATSKIRDESELAHIATLGFRGEALASIAAVSSFEITTCADEQVGGYRMGVEGGRIVSGLRLGFPRGTKVVVEDLFGNIPVRKKFLRAPPTEFQHVHTYFTQLALSQPGVQFRLTHNRRAIHDLPPCETLHERVYQLFGREMSEGLIAVAGSEGLLRFDGLVAHPSHPKASRRWQHLMLNDRPVRDTRINHAVYQAYRTLLMKERHPAYFLNLRLAPTEVDVNVHPTKTEVRLRNAQWVHTVLSRQLNRQLMEATRREIWPGGSGAPASIQAAPELPLAGVAGRRPDPAFPGDGVHPVQDGGRGALAQGASSWPGGFSGAPGRVPFSEGAAAPPGEGQGPGSGLQENPYASDAFHFQPLTAPGAAAAATDGQSPYADALIPDEISVLGQFHTTYILAQRRDSLVLVDQHAAHERILFEQIRTQFYNRAPLTETYLIPLNLEMSVQNALLLEQYLPQWNQLGFEIEPFGKNSFKVSQIPALLGKRNIEKLVLEVLDELALFGKSGRLEEALNEIMERMACHGAIRAGMHLSREEMEALLAQLKGMDVNLYCPHGRPVWIEISVFELEKRFKRTV